MSDVNKKAHLFILLLLASNSYEFRFMKPSTSTLHPLFLNAAHTIGRFSAPQLSLRINRGELKYKGGEEEPNEGYSQDQGPLTRENSLVC